MQICEALTIAVAADKLLAHVQKERDWRTQRFDKEIAKDLPYRCQLMAALPCSQLRSSRITLDVRFICTPSLCLESSGLNPKQVVKLLLVLSTTEVSNFLE